MIKLHVTGDLGSPIAGMSQPRSSQVTAYRPFPIWAVCLPPAFAFFLASSVDARPAMRFVSC
jgi:hypothetical protein